MSTIGRYEYKKSCTLLVQLFDESVQTYQSLISSGQTGIETTVQEGRIAFCVNCRYRHMMDQQIMCLQYLSLSPNHIHHISESKLNAKLVTDTSQSWNWVISHVTGHQFQLGQVRPWLSMSNPNQVRPDKHSWYITFVFQNVPQPGQVRLLGQNDHSGSGRMSKFFFSVPTLV